MGAFEKYAFHSQFSVNEKRTEERKSEQSMGDREYCEESIIFFLSYVYEMYICVDPKMKRSYTLFNYYMVKR